MKKVAAKIITIFSQLLVASVFLFLLFSGETRNSNDRSVVVNNNNFNKMADKTLFLFNSLETKDEESPKKEETSVTPLEPDFSDKKVLETFTGSLTGYGPDCYGCGGRTSTGYDLRENIYYDDAEYGTIRIVAADKYFPFYSIIRISNVPGMEPFIAIVLDRGGDVGWYRNSVSGEIMFDSQKGTLFDLAFTTEKDPNILGKTNNVKFEVLRSGR